MTTADGNMSRDGAVDDRERFLQLALRNPINAALLERLPALGLPDGYLVSGCLFQTVWNHLYGHAPAHGILDYDVFYFDASDLSWEAEDAVIRRCDAAFSDLDGIVEVRNQARVHLWYPQKFGGPYPPLTSSRDGIDTFLNRSSCFGVRREPDGRLEVYAPHGFTDVFRGVVRPNPRIDRPAIYYRKAARWRKEWPRLTVLPWPGFDELGVSLSERRGREPSSDLPAGRSRWPGRTPS